MIINVPCAMLVSNGLCVLDFLMRGGIQCKCKRASTERAVVAQIAMAGPITQKQKKKIANRPKAPSFWPQGVALRPFGRVRYRVTWPFFCHLSENQVGKRHQGQATTQALSLAIQ